MVVPMNPCRRRGGLWWRMDVGSGREENRGKGENKGRWRINAGKEERKGRGSGFLQIRSRRWECRLLKFFKNKKPSLGMPAIENLFKSRCCQRRSLPPVSKRTSLVIFLKTALEFGFLFFKGLLPYKTP